jgi:hypothetical protein
MLCPGKVALELGVHWHATNDNQHKYGLGNQCAAPPNRQIVPYLELSLESESPGYPEPFMALIAFTANHVIDAA